MDDFGIKVRGIKERDGIPKPEPRIYKLNGEEITEWDLKFLYIHGERLTAEQIAEVFDVEPYTVIRHMWYYGIVRRWQDKVLHNKIRAEQDAAERKQKEQRLKREVEKRMKATPKPERVQIGRHSFIDVFQKSTYDEIVQEVKDDIHREEEKQRKDRFANKWVGGMSSITGLELKAIRLYRGLDRMAFAGIAKVKPSFIQFYEADHYSVVPSLVEDMYIQTLNIKPKELKKIRETLAGRRTLEEEQDREIPEYIRKEVMTRDKGKCTSCGRDKHIHFHHIKKYSDGGMHRTDNLKLLCVACHASTHRDDKSFHMLKKMALDLLGVTV